MNLRAFSAIVWVVLAATFAVPCTPAAAQTKERKKQSSSKTVEKAVEPETTKPDDYRSQHFYVRTDLKPSEAKELLGRLETMLKLMSKYWGKAPNGVIECYVVKDPAKWDKSKIDPEGWQSIERGGGITLVRTLQQGHKVLAAKATVYSVAALGTPLHESVHAYCGQTFGTPGPVWYAEGMAEIGNYWREGEKAVDVPDYVIEHIRNSPRKSLLEIVDPNQLSGDSWQNYAWRWALCHLLDFSPNYSKRFRVLGHGFLHQQNVSFEQTFGEVANEIQFEYDQFLQNFDNGYRVDLCSWEWNRKFVPLLGARTISAKIESGRGWQPSSALVTGGAEYSFKATGTWNLSTDGEAVSADGQDDGAGRLVGAVFNDYQLSEPFDLGASGTFKAPTEGKLYLRCNDAWKKLADNKGSVTVKLKPKDASARAKD